MTLDSALAVGSVAAAVVFCALWLLQAQRARRVRDELQRIKEEWLEPGDDLALLEKLSASDELDVRLVAEATRALLLADDWKRLAVLGVTGTGLRSP